MALVLLSAVMVSMKIFVVFEVMSFCIIISLVFIVFFVFSSSFSLKCDVSANNDEDAAVGIAK